MSKTSVAFICLEVSMMGATRLFPNLPHLLSQILFWGGLAGLIITFGFLTIEKLGFKLVIPIQKANLPQKTNKSLSDLAKQINASTQEMINSNRQLANQLDDDDIGFIGQGKYKAETKTFSYKDALPQEYRGRFDNPKYWNYRIVYMQLVVMLDQITDRKIPINIFPRGAKQATFIFFVPIDWKAKIFIHNPAITNDKREREITIFREEIIDLEKEYYSDLFIRFRIEYDRTAQQRLIGDGHNHLFVFLKSFTL